MAVARPTPVLSESRLAPPVHLPDAERDVWLQVVNDQPASSFTETHAPMLELYCRHVVLSRILAHERESRAASSAATRLRITRQAIDQQTVARAIVNAPKAKKPWEIDV